MKLECERYSLPLTRPLTTAYGEITARELLLVSLTDDEGVVGYGEAAPLEAYDQTSIARVQAALHRHAAVVANARDLSGGQLLDACRRADGLPAALAAIDLALWDRAGRISEKPVAALITDAPELAVPVNATITAFDHAEAAKQAAAAAAAGFRCVKLKVGFGDDASRLDAVRAAVGPELALRVDANGSWNVEQAVHAIEQFVPARLEFVEEPVHGVREVREVRERVPVRIAIDETAAEHGALDGQVADAVCLKISRCGGIGGLIAAAALVRASRAEAYIASTLDGPLGVAAGVHAAAALASRGPMPFCGLDTLSLFEGLENPLSADSGKIKVPLAPGLGVDPP
jgi:o-succinylbenzoate synthase